MLILFLIGGAAAVLWWRAHNALPAALRGASLHLNEKNLSIKRPVALSGRPDQVWLSRDGQLVVTDTKNRKSARVYDSDVIQLSAYAYMLRQLEAHPVSDTAYVRAPALLGSRFVPVTLLPGAEVEALHARYHALLSGEIAARCNGSDALCRHCGHQPRCPRWQG